MDLPQSLPEAVSMLGTLVADDNLWLGLGTVATVLVVSGFVTWLILEVRR